MLPRWAVGCFVLLGINLAAPLPAPGADAKALALRGHSWLVKGEYDRALEALDEALRIDPKMVAIYGWRAVVYREQGQFDKALAEVNAGLRQANSQDPPRTSFLYNVRGTIWLDKHEPGKAVDDYSEAIRLDPKNAVALTNRGLERLRQDQFDAALADLNEALRRDPKHHPAWVGRGRVWLAKKQPELAMADFTEAIRLNPKSSGGYFGRGSVRAIQGDNEPAMEDFNKALTLDPHDALALLGRGALLCDQRDFERAVADLTEAIRLRPKTVEAYRVRGYARAGKREYAKAIEDFTLALALRPESASVPRSLTQRAACYVEQNECDKALDDCNRAMQRDPQAPDAYGVRGNAWLHKRQYDKAFADLTQSIRLDSKFAYGYRVLAWLQATCPDEQYRDGAKAVDNAINAGRLNSGKEWRDYGVLAAARAECGEFEAAVKWQTKSIAMAENDPWVWRQELAAMQRILAAYRQGQPCRQSFSPETLKLDSP